MNSRSDIFKGDGAEAQSGFGGLRYNTPPPPRREQMLERAIRLSPETKESNMTIITRMLFGRRWYVKAAALAGIITVAALIATLPRQTSQAQESGGFVLTYDLGTAPEGESQGYKVPGGIEDKVEPFHAAIKAFLDERKAAAKAAGADYSNKVSIRLMNENGKVTLVIGLANADEALMHELKGRLAAAVPGLPEPQVQDATWFSRGELDMEAQDGLTLLFNGHVFTFGEGFTAEEVERTLNDWLAQNRPGAKAKVTVEKSSGGEGEHRIEVKVEVEDPAHVDAQEAAKPTTQE